MTAATAPDYFFYAVDSETQLNFPCATCRTRFDYRIAPKGDCSMLVVLHDTSKPGWDAREDIAYCGACLAKAYPRLDVTKIQNLLPHHALYFQQCQDMLDWSIPDGPLNGLKIHTKYSIYDLCVGDGMRKNSILQQLHEWGADLSTSLSKDCFAVMIDSSCKEIMRVLDLNHPKFAVARNLNIPVICDELVIDLKKLFFSERWLEEDILQIFESMKVSEWGAFDVGRVKRRVVGAAEGGSQGGSSEEAAGGAVAAGGGPQGASEATAGGALAAGGGPEDASEEASDGDLAAAAADEAGQSLLLSTLLMDVDTATPGVPSRASSLADLMEVDSDPPEISHDAALMGPSDDERDDSQQSHETLQQAGGGSDAKGDAHRGGSGSSQDSEEELTGNVSLESFSLESDEDDSVMEIDRSEEDRLLADDEGSEHLRAEDSPSVVSPPRRSVAEGVDAPTAEPTINPKSALFEKPVTRQNPEPSKDSVLQEVSCEGDKDPLADQWVCSILNPEYCDGTVRLTVCKSSVRPHPMCGLKNVRLLNETPEHATSLVATRFGEAGRTEFTIVELLVDVTTKNITIWRAHGFTDKSPKEFGTEKLEFNCNQREQAKTQFHRIVYELTGTYGGHLKRNWNEHRPHVYYSLHSTIEKYVRKYISEIPIHPLLQDLYCGPFFNLPEIECTMLPTPSMKNLPLLATCNTFIPQLQRKVKQCSQGKFNAQTAAHLMRLLFQWWPQANVIPQIQSWEELKDHVTSYESKINKIIHELKMNLVDWIKSKSFTEQAVPSFHTILVASFRITPLTRRDNLFKCLESNALKAGAPGEFRVQYILKLIHHSETSSEKHHLLWADLPNPDTSLRDIFEKGIPCTGSEFSFHDIPTEGAPIVLRAEDEHSTWACAVACSVNLGKMLTITSKNHLQRLHQNITPPSRIATGFDSILLEGSFVPDPKERRVLEANLEMNCGQLIPNPRESAPGDKMIGRTNMYKIPRRRRFPRYLVFMSKSK